MRLSLFAIAALCVSSLAAHADTVTQYVLSGPFSTSDNYQSNPLILNGFNPELGTLNSITLAFSGPYVVTQTGTRNVNGFNSSLDVKLQLGADGGSQQVGGLVKQSETGTGPFTFAGFTSDFNAANLAYFTTAGTVDPYFVYVDGLAGKDTSSNFTIALTYDYAPAATSAVTPEPSSIALLGTGLLGIAGVMRKRFLGTLEA